MKGPYIDYAYIAAMDDIQKSFDFHEQKNLHSLQQKGLLVEDFLGDVTLTENCNAYRPIFFGNQEGRLEICGPGGEPKFLDLRFHFMDKQTVITSLNEKLITCWSLTQDEVKNSVKSILNLSEDRHLQDNENKIITIKDAFKVYVVTFGEADGNSVTKVWYEKDDALFEKTDTEITKCVTAENVINEIDKMFKGGK